MNWIYNFLKDSSEKNLCTKISCTTCGASDFREGLVRETLKASSALESTRDTNKLTSAGVDNALKALSELKLTVEEYYHFHEPIMLILFDISKFKSSLEISHELGSGCVADIFNSMFEDHKSRVERRRIHEENNDPEIVRMRRKERKAAVQKRHQERLALKKVRDLEWRSNHSLK